MRLRSLAVLSLIACTSPEKVDPEPDPLCDRAWAWTQHDANPVIGIPSDPGDPFYGWIWNDPSVLLIDGTYHMWLSGGSAFHSPHDVYVYHATSTDRLTWSIDPDPVLSPSPTPTDWDSLRIETPSVIKVGDTFHMYFSGCDGDVWGCGEQNNGHWAMGHATSADGIVWTKDPSNPIMLQPDDTKWGYPGLGEPGAFYNAETEMFHVYGVSGGIVDGVLRAGIMLGTSPDGYDLQWYVDDASEAIPVMTNSPGYPYAEGWLGNSTPMVFRDSGGTIHMFYDVMGTGYRQQAIAHAISDDGFTFTEVETDIATSPNLGTAEAAWNDNESLGETVLEEADGSLSMWFAGKKVVYDGPDLVYYGFGIGYARGVPYCR